MPVAIVTAGDSGIGRSTCVLLAQRGFDVGLTWHADQDGALETAEEVRGHGRRAEVAQLDLTEPASGPGVVGELADALGGIDVLVDNAGMGDRPPSTGSAASPRWRRWSSRSTGSPSTRWRRARSRRR